MKCAAANTSFSSMHHLYMKVDEIVMYGRNIRRDI